MNKEYIAPWVRVSILIVSIVVIFYIVTNFYRIFYPERCERHLDFSRCPLTYSYWCRIIRKVLYEASGFYGEFPYGYSYYD